MYLKVKKLLSILLILAMLISSVAGCSEPANYLVIFDSMGGSPVVSQAVKAGEMATKPSDPQKAGFTFVEWQLNNKPYDFNTAVNENLTLTAVYKIADGIQSIIITLDFQNGEANKTVEIIKGGEFFEPIQPQKQGYTFVGWYLNDEKFDFSTKLNENITLTAKWEVAESSNTQSSNNKLPGNKNNTSANNKLPGNKNNTSVNNNNPNNQNTNQSNK